MSENLGSGISLDENFDFTVDETGDIGADFGVEELEKDLSFQMAISLSPFLGSTVTGTSNSQIKNAVVRVLTSDPRVASVNRDDIDIESADNHQQLNVDVTITTNTEEEYTLVFEV